MKNPITKPFRRAKSSDVEPVLCKSISSVTLREDANTGKQQKVSYKMSDNNSIRSGIFEKIRSRIRRTSLRGNDDSDHGFLQPGPCQGKWTIAAPSASAADQCDRFEKDCLNSSTHMPLRARRSVPARLTLHSEESVLPKSLTRSLKHSCGTSLPFHGSAVAIPPPVPERSPVSLGLIPMTPIPRVTNTPSSPMGNDYEIPSGFAPLSPCVMFLDHQKPMGSPISAKPLPPLPKTEESETDELVSEDADELLEPPGELAPLAPPSDLLYRPPHETFSVTTELRKLSKCAWYWGPISRSEAEKRLLNQSDGTFLVRNSLDRRYLLSLSFRSLDQTLHARIEYDKGRFSFYPQLDGETYSSVVELVDNAMRKATVCYSRSREPDSPTFPVRLLKPVSRFSEVRSLKYLCRFTVRLHIRADYLDQATLPGSIRKFILSVHT